MTVAKGWFFWVYDTERFDGPFPTKDMAKDAYIEGGAVEGDNVVLGYLDHKSPAGGYDLENMDRAEVWVILDTNSTTG